MIETVKLCQEYSDIQIISLAPPRGDSEDLHYCTMQVNIELEQYFENNHKVYICNNRNLSQQGYPADHLFHYDMVHLSRMGCIKLYKNLKYTVHKCFGTSFNAKSDHLNDKYRYKSIRSNTSSYSTNANGYW
jgi:V8-like Glu-specific endopeptidase